MDSSNFVTEEAPALIGVGAQSIVDQARQLGLTWTLQPGTVTQTVFSVGQVRFDGDTVGINVINLSEGVVLTGNRVMGILTPTGNYVIGTIGNYTSAWALMVLGAGWTNSGPTTANAAYRRISPNNVQLVGEIVAGTTADATTIATLPPGFRPLKDVAFPIARNPAATTGVLGPLLQLQSSGVLRCFGLTGASTIWFSVVVPLDSP